MIDFNAFADEFEKIALSPQYRAAAAAETNRRLGAVKETMRSKEYTLDDSVRATADKQYARLQRKVAPFEGTGPTRHTLNKNVRASSEMAKAQASAALGNTSVGRRTPRPASTGGPTGAGQHGALIDEFATKSIARSPLTQSAQMPVTQTATKSVSVPRPDMPAHVMAGGGPAPAQAAQRAVTKAPGVFSRMGAAIARRPVGAALAGAATLGAGAMGARTMAHRRAHPQG